MATIRPNSVVTNASEMPDDSIFGSPVPNTLIRRKVLIMPVTVPSRPSSGAVAAANATKGIHRSS